MSSPRDRDGFDDHGSGDWREPEHLGGEDAAASGRPGEPPAADSAGATAWQPPGWELPAVEPDRPRAGTDLPAPGDAPSAASPDVPAADPRQGELPPGPPAPDAGPVRGRGLFGSRRPRTPGVAEQVFRRETDPVGVQAWALHHGWVASDGTGPQDAPLAELVRSAPVRPAKEDRPGNVVRGRGMGLDLVAFDVVFDSGRYQVPRWAVTAAPVLGEVPGFRLSPARFWKHGTAGLVHLPSGDPEFDTRWVLLASADDPRLRRVVEDPVVRQLLLGTDDGDELWSAAGFVAAVRPDGHRPQLIEHHARLLAVVVGALATAV
jgi:hypothetical protein